MIPPPGAALTADRLLSDPDAVRQLQRIYRQAVDLGLVNPDTEIVVGEIADRMLARPDCRAVGWTDVDAWVRLQAADLVIRWTAGQATTCTCMPTPEQGRPVATALWKPGLISCVPCAKYLFKLSEVEDRRCDCCGRITEGMQLDDGIFPNILQVGLLLVHWGACGDCRQPSQHPHRGEVP